MLNWWSMLLALSWAAGPSGESPKPSSSAAPAPPAAAATPATPSAAPDSRTSLNLLGKTDSQAGESRRNENVQFNLIDNNALKELNIRLGTTATIASEFEASRNYYGVEFGNSPASPSHVARRKAGSAVHGTLFLTHNNSVFSSRSFFQVGGVKPSHENNYGVNLSSPLGKLGFLSVEGSQQKIRGSVNGNILVPRADERVPLATDPAIRALVLRWIAAYPAAPPNRTDINERALNTNAPQIIDTNTAGIRWDKELQKNSRFTFRHNWTTQNVDAFQLLAGQNPDTSTRSHNSRLTFEHAFNARSILQATLGFDRVHSLLVPEPNAVGNFVQIGSAFTSLGPSSTLPIDRVQNRFRQAAMWRLNRGRQSFHFGGEFSRLQFNGRETSSNRGNYYFRNDTFGDAIPNFLRGIPSRFSTGIGPLDRGFRRWEQQWFAGGTWQATPSLSLNYGVRFEPALGLKEVNNLTRIDYGCDCNNFAPRFGFAKRLPRKMGTLRGAYGLHYGELFAVAFQQLRWNPPTFLKIEVQAPRSLLNPLQGIAISPTTRATLFDVPSSIRTPYSHQFNFSWEAELARNWRLQLGYVGSRTKSLLYLWHTNRATSVPGIALSTATIPDRRPDQQHFEIRRVTNAGRGWFDAGRATLILPNWRRMSIDASYWWSKAQDVGGGYTNTAAGDDSRNAISQTEFEIARDLKAPSSFDQAHAALVRWRYTLPSARANGYLKHFTRDWTLSLVWLAKTGMPFSVLSGSDGPGFGNVDGSNGDRVNILQPSILGRTVGHPDTSRQLLPRSAFGFIGIGERAGNIGVNTFRRGGIRNTNIALSRNWKLASERSVVLRAESVNFTNTPQFAEPNADLTSPAFGMITNTLNDGRAFQFTLQFSF